jgi:lipoate-protein ligase B
MLKIESWGLIDYEQALAKQLANVEEIAESRAPGYLIFCSHPPIVTLGRKTESDDVFAWKGEIKEISRGGRATYHGPSQLVVYPILNLELPGPQRKPKDIASFLRQTEEAIIATLKKYKIEAHGKSGDDDTGVWVANKKIASLGIAVKKWISYHGAAINLSEDPQAFQGMRPCGLSQETMTNLERLTGEKISHPLFQEALKLELLSRL